MPLHQRTLSLNFMKQCDGCFLGLVHKHDKFIMIVCIFRVRYLILFYRTSDWICVPSQYSNQLVTDLLSSTSEFWHLPLKMDWHGWEIGLSLNNSKYSSKYNFFCRKSSGKTVLPSLWKASRSDLQPTFLNCTHNYVTSVLFCLTTFRKKTNCILL